MILHETLLKKASPQGRGLGREHFLNVETFKALIGYVIELMIKPALPRCSADKPRPKRVSWLFRIPTHSRPSPMDPADLRCLVEEYLEHCRGDFWLKDASVAITAMTFMSPPEEQWRMLLEAVRQAQDQKDLRHIAAGPIEGLLGRHGPEYIGRVESQAAAARKFAEAMLYVRTYTMAAGVWARVEAVQGQIRGS